RQCCATAPGCEVQILDYTAGGTRWSDGPQEEGAMTTRTTAEVGHGSKHAKVGEIDGFRGRLIRADHADYDLARSVWNGGIDGRPRAGSGWRVVHGGATLITRRRRTVSPSPAES